MGNTATTPSVRKPVIHRAGGIDPSAQRLLDMHMLQDELTSSPYSHDVLELALATATSLPIAEEGGTALVWLLIVGAPRSDKTQTVLLLKGTQSAYYLDALTENCFVTGYVDPKSGASPKDLLPELQGKCLIIKDLTTLFSQREDKVKKILGDLQSIYDGEYTKATGTRGTIGYESKFAILGCITPAALVKHHTYMSRIGGRFLLYRVSPLTDEEREGGFALSWEVRGRKAKVEQLRGLVTAHAAFMRTAPVDLHPETDEQRNVIERLALLLARGRGITSPELQEPQIEEPYRALWQLRNLGRALARVHSRTHMTSHELELLRRVVLCSIPDGRAKVLAQFPERPDGLTSKTCAAGMGKSDDRARQLLEELVAVGLLVKAGKEVREALYVPVPPLSDLIVKPVTPLDHVEDLAPSVSR
jgi:hypothetical protein